MPKLEWISANWDKPKITIGEVQAHPHFKELMTLLQKQEATPKLVGGLVRRGWTKHDIDIEVSKIPIKVPLEFLCLKFGKKGWYLVSIDTK